jgi:hypothetical protein
MELGAPLHPQAKSSPGRGGNESHSRAVLPLVPADAPFAELVRLSRTSIADEMHEERLSPVLGE